MTTLTRKALDERAAKLKDETFPVKVGELEGAARKLTHTQITEYRLWLTDNEGNLDKSKWQSRKKRLIGLCLLDGESLLMYPGAEFEAVGELPEDTVNELYDQIEKGCGVVQYQEEDNTGSVNFTESESSEITA